MQFKTLCANAPRDRERDAGAARQALVPPVHFSSTYDFESLSGVDDFFERGVGFQYGRYANPTVTATEQLLAELEAGERAVLFGSGMAAISTAILSIAGSGDTIAAQDGLYGGTCALMEGFLPGLGIETRWIAIEALADGDASPLEGCALLYLETPVNPTLRIVDLERVTATARRAGVPVLVDGTFGTPALQRPLELGCDVVLHSCTKYLGGHGDLIGGAAVGAAPRLARIEELRRKLGGICDPLTAFLLHRGMRTLAVRMEAHCRGAEAVARALTGHPAVEAVHWPGFEDRPDHAVAKRQMRGFGGMVSFDVRGGLQAARGVHDRVELFARTGSLGGTESLLSIPSTMSHRFMSPQQRARCGVGDGMIRLSIGLEHPDDLIDDLRQALG